jgi:hypothetical protein
MDKVMNIKIPRHIAVANNEAGSNAKDLLSQKNGAHSMIYFTNGDTYTGEWKDNLKHGEINTNQGKGSYKYKKSGHHYIGEWKFDKRDGYGVLSIPLDAPTGKEVVTEDSVFGGSKNDKKKNPNEIVKMKKLYTGEWKNGVKYGHGTYFYPDGSVYEGSWQEDVRQGWGRQLYPDGSVYEGEWHHETRHGQGLLLLRKVN